MITDDPAPAPEDPRPLTPKARRLEFTDGVPLAIAGEEWLLPLMLTAEGMDPVREEILAFGHMRGSYPAGVLQKAGEILLGSNYDLTGPEQWLLIAQVRLDDLRDVVEECLLAQAGRPREYRDWVRSSLLANALDPDAIADADLPHVLHQLVSTGRAIPAHEFLDVAVQGAQRAELLRGAKVVKAAPSPAAGPGA